jgi:hypothetical protein
MSISEDYNYSKIVEIQKIYMRLVRKPMLEKLDIEFMKALEDDNQELKMSVISQKNALRDVTNIDFSTYDSFENIQAYFPEILGGSQALKDIIEDVREGRRLLSEVIE